MASITRDLLKTLRADIDAALAAVAAKHGIAIECANGSFAADGSAGSLKLELAAKPEGGSDASASQLRAQADWAKYCAMFGLPKDALGKTVMYAGEQMTVIGLMPKRSKFPVLARKASGREILLPAEPVIALLKTA